MKIYIIKCLETGMCYIGKTIQDGDKRFKAHFSEARNQPKNECVYLNRAIRKYGEDKFIFKVLKTADTDKELNKLESKYIKIFNTIVPNGYNLTYGGEGCRASEETKRKMSEWQIGGTKSDKHKSSMSEYAKNRPKEHQEKLDKLRIDRCVGSKASEETKDKMTKSRMKISYEQILEISKIQDRTHVSISKDYNINPGHVSRIRLGWRPRGWDKFLEENSLNDI